MTPQQSDVLIALTRGYPRTTAGMAAELGVPEPSIRRVIHQLRQQRYIIEADRNIAWLPAMYTLKRSPKRAYRG